MTNISTRLNYHHLHYFWAVASEGNLTRAARKLHIAQSALSTQIRQLETQLGQRLFERRGRRLELTEAGRLTLEYAGTIVETGNELVATLRDGRRSERHLLRVGAVATLSRNFQRAFLEPVLSDGALALSLQSGSLTELLSRLRAHTLDVVLSNRRVPEDADHAWRSRRIARQPVSLVGPPRPAPFRFPDDLGGVVLVLPSKDHEFRTQFDLICDERAIRTTILAEADDMAMLRVLARELDAVTLVPAVVVRDELRSGELEEYCTVPDLYEEFHAISVARQYQSPLVQALLARRGTDMLAEHA